MRKLFTLSLLCGALCAPFTAATAGAPDPALTAVIEARSDEQRARDVYRHPAQTLTFFKLAPGMTVAEALPGRGWYTTILANYLGGDGALYGINYPDRLWPLFSWATEEIVAERVAATGKFPSMVREVSDSGVSSKGFTFGKVPPEVAGTVDRVLLIRALHNLNRFEEASGTRSQALAAVRAMLKPDGLVGVVQHRLPETASDEKADGSRGYMKQSLVIKVFAEAGFELVDTSEINANPKDKPGADDIVWRLPPNLSGSKDDAERRAAMIAIGESDRMTLLFRKAD